MDSLKEGLVDLSKESECHLPTYQLQSWFQTHTLLAFPLHNARRPHHHFPGRTAEDCPNRTGPFSLEAYGIKRPQYDHLLHQYQVTTSMFSPKHIAKRTKMAFEHSKANHPFNLSPLFEPFFSSHPSPPKKKKKLSLQGLAPHLHGCFQGSAEP